MGKYEDRRAKGCTGQGSDLSQKPVDLSEQLSAGWPDRTEQQPGGAQHKTICDIPEELPVCQHAHGGAEQRGDLQFD